MKQVRKGAMSMQKTNCFLKKKLFLAIFKKTRWTIVKYIFHVKQRVMQTLSAGSEQIGLHLHLLDMYKY